MARVAPSILFVAAAALLGSCTRPASPTGATPVPSPSDGYADAYPADDAHNHDGTHPPAATNCGTNYMLPGELAPLGSHSFIIIGKDGPSHIIASHRSGTPPHNYQFLFRVRLDPDEMRTYEKVAAESTKTLPAFTTIWFDRDGKQLDRTFWCLEDLPRIFGKEQKRGDEFERLFPIHASLQKNPEHEGGFDIPSSISGADHFTLAREDFALIVNRYLPSYLPQDAFRKAIVERRAEVVPLLRHSPIRATEPVAQASARKSYAATDGAVGPAGRTCARSTFLTKTPVPETIHSFLLVAEDGPNAVLASHYYDASPQNFQTVVRLRLSDAEMRVVREARGASSAPPLFKSDSAFCMAALRELVKRGSLSMRGTVYVDSTLDAYALGTPAGTLDIAAADVDVLLNRRLESLLDPIDVATDVLGARP